MVDRTFSYLCLMLPYYEKGLSQKIWNCHCFQILNINIFFVVVIIIIIVAIIIITTRALPDSKLFFQECRRPFLQLIDITQLAFALSFIRFANMWQNWFVLRPSLWFTTGYWAVWSNIHLIQPSRIVQCSWIRAFKEALLQFMVVFLYPFPYWSTYEATWPHTLSRIFHFSSMKALSNVQQSWSRNWLHQYCFSRSNMRVFGRTSLQTIAS